MVLWFIITAIAAVVALGAFVFLFMPDTRGTAAATLVATVGIWFVASLFFTVSTVDAGYAGLVKRFGAYQPEVKEAGAVFHKPWESIESVRIRNASHDVHMDNKAGGSDGPAGSKETQPVYVTAVLNYSLTKSCVKDLYTNYGSGYYESIVEPRVKQIFKAETVKFEAISILPNREKIRRETQQELTKQLEPYCLTGIDFLLKNIGFDPEFEAAIVEKQVATQNAAAERNKVAVARATANQLRVQARADAYANRLRSKSLTPVLVEWERIQKWQPEVIYLPSDSLVVAGKGAAAAATGR